MVSNWQSFLC